MTFDELIALDEDSLFNFLQRAADIEVKGGENYTSLFCFLDEQISQKIHRCELTPEQVDLWKTATTRIAKWLIEDRAEII